MPLALEMAAARTPLLGVEGLRSGLTERLSLLKHDARRSDGRHRSLRQMVAWSYHLLDEIDQKVFGRLAIFPGSFALDAAVAIVAPLGLDRWEAVDALWRLREKSLIVVEQGAPLRYRLLETLRLYAIEALGASGDSDAVAEAVCAAFRRGPKTGGCGVGDNARSGLGRPVWAGNRQPAGCSRLGRSPSLAGVKARSRLGQACVFCLCWT